MLYSEDFCEINNNHLSLVKLFLVLKHSNCDSKIILKYHEFLNSVIICFCYCTKSFYSLAKKKKFSRFETTSFK